MDGIFFLTGSLRSITILDSGICRPDHSGYSLPRKLPTGIPFSSIAVLTSCPRTPRYGASIPLDWLLQNRLIIGNRHSCRQISQLIPLIIIRHPSDHLPTQIQKKCPCRRISADICKQKPGHSIWYLHILHNVGNKPISTGMQLNPRGAPLRSPDHPVGHYTNSPNGINDRGNGVTFIQHFYPDTDHSHTGHLIRPADRSVYFARLQTSLWWNSAFLHRSIRKSGFRYSWGSESNVRPSVQAAGFYWITQTSQVLFYSKCTVTIHDPPLQPHL